MTTVTSTDSSILRSAQSVLSDATRQFKEHPVGTAPTRNLSLSDVVGQLKTRRESETSKNALPASVKGSPELTAPTTRALMLAVMGAGGCEGGQPDQATRAGEAATMASEAGKPAQGVAGKDASAAGRARSANAASTIEQSAQAEDLDPATLRGAAALRYWIAMIQEKVDETTESQLVNTLDRFRESNKAQRDFHDKKSEEIQKKEEAAQKASQIMGCLAKIVGAVVTVAAIVSAVFTGGSSLLLAGLGLALMAADAIAEKVTGQSLTGRLLSPLMEKVFAPLAKAMGDAIASVLKKLNVSDDIADIIGAIAGAVATAIAVVAIAVVAKSAQIGKFAGKLAQPMMKSVGKMMPKLITNVASKLSGALSKGMAKVGNFSSALTRNATRLTQHVGLGSAQVAALQAQRAMVAASAVNGTSQAGFQGWLGVNSKQIADASAEITELFTDMDMLRRGLDLGVNHWQEQLSRTSSLEKMASDAMQSAQNTQLFVLSNARRAAAF